MILFKNQTLIKINKYNIKIQCKYSILFFKVNKPFTRSMMSSRCFYVTKALYHAIYAISNKMKKLNKIQFNLKSFTIRFHNLPITVYIINLVHRYSRINTRFLVNLLTLSFTNTYFVITAAAFRNKVWIDFTFFSSIFSLFKVFLFIIIMFFKYQLWF